jgi:Bacterial regulatory helix-turn-helix protein, lysR family
LSVSAIGKKPALNWNDLRHVLAVARARALAPAAKHLGVYETTVARRIARAEHSLGSKLFDRIEGAMVPTEAGEIAVERAERMEVEAMKPTDGQPLAYVYSRGSEAEARRAKMLTEDEARRIAVKVTRLPETLGKAAGGTARCLGALVAADKRVCGSDRQSVVARRRT